MSIGNLVPQFFSSTFLRTTMAPSSFSDCKGGAGGAAVAWGTSFSECCVGCCLSFCLPLGGAHLVEKVAGKLCQVALEPCGPHRAPSPRSSTERVLGGYGSSLSPHTQEITPGRN